jgi:hypothetical protein
VPYQYKEQQQQQQPPVKVRLSFLYSHYSLEVATAYLMLCMCGS